MKFDLPEKTSEKVERLLNSISESRNSLYEKTKSVVKLKDNIFAINKTLEEMLENKKETDDFIKNKEVELSLVVTEFVRSIIETVVEQDFIAPEIKEKLKAKILEAVTTGKYDVSLTTGKIRIDGLDKETEELLTEPEEDFPEFELHQEDSWVELKNTE